MIVRFQMPPLAFVDTSAWPPSSMATQSNVEAHDTAERLPPLSIVAVLHLEGLLAGLVEVSAYPPTTATQNELDAQDTLIPPADFAGLHVGLMALGSVDVIMGPEFSTATHKIWDGHDIPFSGAVPTVCVSTF